MSDACNASNVTPHQAGWVSAFRGQVWCVIPPPPFSLSLLPSHRPNGRLPQSEADGVWCGDRHRPAQLRHSPGEEGEVHIGVCRRTVKGRVVPECCTRHSQTQRQQYCYWQCQIEGDTDVLLSIHLLSCLGCPFS